MDLITYSAHDLRREAEEIRKYCFIVKILSTVKVE